MPHPEQDHIVRATDRPPGTPGEPYVISSQEGDIVYVPLSRSLTRLLVTATETSSAFAIVGRSGSEGDSTGFYAHQRSHNVFICLKGSIKFWIDDDCRTLGPGDFVSVPPDTAQQYQFVGDHSDMISLLLPGGGEEFFRAIGESVSGPFWPLHDDRGASEVLGPRVRSATERFDVTLRTPRRSAASSPWTLHDTSLPGRTNPYFLRHASGPACVAGGTLIRPLITTRESDGRFAVASFEGSSHHHDNGLFFGNETSLRFLRHHHAFLVVEGVIEFVIDDCLPALLPAGQLIYVPASVAFALHFRSRYGKLYAFASGSGLVGLACRLGASCSLPVPPNSPNMVDWRALRAMQSELAFEIC